MLGNGKHDQFSVPSSENNKIGINKEKDDDDVVVVVYAYYKNFECVA